MTAPSSGDGDRAGAQEESALRICMVLYDMQDFGGLEEIATAMAVGLKARGHPTAVLSACWVSPENQYAERLREYDVPVVQLPKWLSKVASNWDTKLRILDAAVRLGAPVVYSLAVVLWLWRGTSWAQAVDSARGWLRRQLLQKVVGPDRRAILARALLAWWRLRWRPDVLHVHGYTTSLMFAVKWATARSIPVVYQEHQTPEASPADRQDVERIINRVPIVMAVSNESADALRRHWGVKGPIVVQGPILPDPLQGMDPPSRRPPASGVPMTVTTIARLYEKKGLFDLLEAIHLITQRRLDVRFRVFGTGPLRANLLDRARELNLRGEEIFSGTFESREQLSRILAETDVFVLPSHMEGQPVTLIEAMAHGCSIVATAVGGIPEVLRDSANGLLCPPADPTSLASRITTLVERDDLRERLGREARRTFREGGFDVDSACRRCAAAYRHAIRAGIADERP